MLCSSFVYFMYTYSTIHFCMGLCHSEAKKAGLVCFANVPKGFLHAENGPRKSMRGFEVMFFSVVWVKATAAWPDRAVYHTVLWWWILDCFTWLVLAWRRLKGLYYTHKHHRHHRQNMDWHMCNIKCTLLLGTAIPYWCLNILV